MNRQIYFRLNLSIWNGRAVAQMVGRRPLTTEARFRSHINPYDICGTGTVFVFELRFSRVSFHQHSILKSMYMFLPGGFITPHVLVIASLKSTDMFVCINWIWLVTAHNLHTRAPAFDCGKGKAFPNTSWRLRRGMKCWASILTLTFGTTRTAELSVLRAGRSLPPWKFLGSHLCHRLNGPQGYWVRTGGLGHLKISKDLTRDLPSLAAVPQASAAPLAP